MKNSKTKLKFLADFYVNSSRGIIRIHQTTIKREGYAKETTGVLTCQ